MTSAQKQMSDAKFYESYSRYLPEESKYESWDEAVERVMNVHKTFYKDKMTEELSNLISISETAYKEKKVLAAQRTLQFGGEQILKKHSKIYNCTSSYVDRVDFFKEAFFLMLSGCGVGFSVQTHHIANLPNIKKRGDEAITFIVEDSIEGWADAVDALTRSFFAVDSEFSGKKIYFDVSRIRPKGAEISGGFKAPGSDPLVKALGLIESVFRDAAEAGRSRLTTLEIYDTVMFIADAVISGGKIQDQA